MDPNSYPQHTYATVLSSGPTGPAYTPNSAQFPIPQSNVLQGLLSPQNPQYPSGYTGGYTGVMPNQQMTQQQYQQRYLQQAAALQHQRLIQMQQAAALQQQIQNMDNISQLVFELTSPDKREAALLELSKKRETVPDLAPILWHSFGTIACLLQEIVAIYSLLSPPKLKAPASNRVCNALALLQCVASHPETRSLFLQAHIPLYLYPFLNTTSKTRPFEYLRLTSLGVIGALVKLDDSDVIGFLLSTEIIPLCLRIMESGSELSKTVATFIVQKILLDEMGLTYICATYERFYAVSSVLGNMVGLLQTMEQPQRLLKHIVRCYLRLAENPPSREALKRCLPESLRTNQFDIFLRDDNTTKRWLDRLNEIMAEPSPPPSNSVQFSQPRTISSTPPPLSPSPSLMMSPTNPPLMSVPIKPSATLLPPPSTLKKN